MKLIVPEKHREFIAKHPRLFRTLLLYTINEFEKMYSERNMVQTIGLMIRVLSRDIELAPRTWLIERRTQEKEYGILLLHMGYRDVLKACGREP